MMAMDSSSRFVASVSADIARAALNTALACIYRHVDTMVTTPQHTPQPIGDPALDALCQAIGAQTFAEISLPDPPRSHVPTHLYIATKLQQSGGHTRVIERLIAAHPQVRHTVLLMRLQMKSSKRVLLHLRRRRRLI